MSTITPVAKKLTGNIEKVIIGKRQEIILSLVSFFCEGHILLEDVPGVAKTVLARSLSQSVGCSFNRAQCTPDLLPTDITGASVDRPQVLETTAMGAAWLAGQRAGIYPDMEGFAETWALERKFEAAMDADLREEKYAAWKRAVAAAQAF